MKSAKQWVQETDSLQRVITEADVLRIQVDAIRSVVEKVTAMMDKSPITGCLLYLIRIEADLLIQKADLLEVKANG